MIKGSVHKYFVSAIEPWNSQRSREIIRGQSNVWRLPKYWPPTPSPPGGRTHSLGREGVGGQYFGRRQTQLFFSTYVSTLCSRIIQTLPSRQRTFASLRNRAKSLIYSQKYHITLHIIYCRKILYIQLTL